jgi:5-methyltetrahydropteroyltriglutamate--homocysteine methyltransferase
METPARRRAGSYPEYADLRRRQIADSASVSNFTPQMTTGPVTYLDTDANEVELSTFADALREVGGDFTDTFMTAPSPGIVAAAIKNEHYPSDNGYLDALGEALRVEYEAAHRRG